MRVLLTNDDGITATGLNVMRRALLELPDVELEVIAPDSNRSATGRAVTLHDPIWVEEVEFGDGTSGFATDGTPVDCVRFAALGLLGDPPDLIVSGINLGLNLGDDVTYSGTVAAALEGALLGLPAIAVSARATDPEAGQWDGRAYDFRAAAPFAARLAEVVMREDFPPRVIVNVNVPGLPPERIRGARVCRLGRREYHDELVLESTEGARRRYTIYGGTAGHRREEGTDFAAIEADEIAVTPMHFDLTDIGGMDHLERRSLADLLEQAPTRP
jgi:5'-nucleotidase